MLTMIYTIKNISIVLIIATSFISYNHAPPRNNPEDQERCISNLENVFGGSLSPIECIKISIVILKRDDNINDDALGYYNMFTKKAKSDAIKLQNDFCKECVDGLPLSEEQKSIKLTECVGILTIFGASKDDILENALYLHRHGVNPFGSKYIHHNDSYSYKYLIHIEGAIELKKDEKLFTQREYCEDRHPCNSDQEYEDDEEENGESSFGIANKPYRVVNERLHYINYSDGYKYQ